VGSSAQGTPWLLRTKGVDPAQRSRDPFEEPEVEFFVFTYSCEAPEAKPQCGRWMMLHHEFRRHKCKAAVAYSCPLTAI
jgi:hypothetical protein